LALDGSIIGHVGDGNFHTNIMVTPEQYDQASAFAEDIVKRALALGGTATGEHGIGLVKRKFMEEEHGPALDWMRQLKQLFDPANILNPGKIL
ncbi:MAG TPA: FAD-linked oxidase C-terminal domain-containing protein, partial [Ktedonobacteraceae bacterium]|nr:FAD-linked oxidase C-terminal domain-containing protein [Ktedonobacteraceae bacterium]